MTPSLPPLLATLLLLASTLPAAAHDTWLLPASFRAPPGRPLTLDCTSGQAFPANEYAIKPERVRRAEVRLAGVTQPLARPRRGARALRYRWTPAAAGVATLAVVLAPKQLELAPDKIEEYLREIDATEQIRAAWAAVPAPRLWREVYTKHATSFVRAGPFSPDAVGNDWEQPLGLDLEIVPGRDPTGLRAGDPLPVRVLRRGEPLPGFAVGVERAGGSGAPPKASVRTDPQGRATVMLPAAGVWLLRGTDLRRSDGPDQEWRSDFVTVTLLVGERSGIGADGVGR